MNFWKDLTERAIKTFFQSLSASLIGTVAFEEVNWIHALSIAGMATLISICTSMGSFNIGTKGTCSTLKINNEEKIKDVHD